MDANAVSRPVRGSNSFKRKGKLPLVKPFVRRIERRNCHINDFHFANGAMAAAGFDHNAGHWLDRKSVVVQLDLPFPFEHDVNLSHSFVIVRSRIFRDVDAVHTGGRTGSFGKSTPRRAAGAKLCGYFIELGNGEALHN